MGLQKPIATPPPVNNKFIVTLAKKVINKVSLKHTVNLVRRISQQRCIVVGGEGAISMHPEIQFPHLIYKN